MAKKSILPDLSERSRKNMEKQIFEETGIDFSQYRTEELGEKIGDLLGVFSWIALVVKVVVIVVPLILLYFHFVITPALTPVDSVWDVVLFIVGAVWAIVSSITVGISLALHMAMKKLSGSASELLALMLDLLEKSAGAVKECTPDQVVRLVTTNAALVFFPLISSAVVANLAIGKFKIPGTKFIAEKVGSVLAIKLSMVIIDKLGFSAEAAKLKREKKAEIALEVIQALDHIEACEKAEDQEAGTIDESDSSLVVNPTGEKVEKKKNKEILVDVLSMVQKVSISINNVNHKLRVSIVKPFAILLGINTGFAFLPPLILWF